MSVVEDLLRSYIAEQRASGDADPGRYLARVRGLDRAELAALIDRHLAESPPPPFDPAAFARFRADPRRRAMADRLLDDTALKDLRVGARVTKERVGVLLAAGLGLAGREQQVKLRYHDLEQGAEDPVHVRPRVWAALGSIFGAPAERVRAAAEAAYAGAHGPAADSMVFARADLGEAVVASLAEAATTPSLSDDAVERAFFED